MKLLIVLSIAVFSQASVIKKTCNGSYILINGVYYERETLVTDVYLPNMLSIDRKTDILYFLDNEAGLPDEYRNNDSVSNVARYDLKTNEYRSLDDITEIVYYSAVDQTNSRVYFGTEDALYMYDYENETSTLLGNNTVLGMLQFGKKQYVTDNFYGALYTYNETDASFTKWNLGSEEIAYFFVDNDEDVFYNNDTGLFYEKKGSGHAVLLKEIEPEVYPFSVDVNGIIYYCDNDGIYTITKTDTVKLTQIYDKECEGIAFDSQNNMIVSEFDTVYRYTPKKNGC